MRAALLVLLTACAHPAPPPPPPASVPISNLAAIGETFTFDSKILGEHRVINVYVPPDYATTPDAHYPVLYMPDGGMKEDFPHVVGSVDVSIKDMVIRPVIVVGVENTERRHDLTGPTTVADEQKAAPHAGGADAFRRFFRDELKPYIAAHYRTSGESVLIGESLAGLFAIETFVVEPTLFDGYIAADPAVYWNEQAAVKQAASRLAALPAGPKQLYIATGDLKEMIDGVMVLKAALESVKPANVTWSYEPMPDEHHNTIFAIAALRGIRKLFALPITPGT